MKTLYFFQICFSLVCYLSRRDFAVFWIVCAPTLSSYYNLSLTLLLSCKKSCLTIPTVWTLCASLYCMAVSPLNTQDNVWNIYWLKRKAFTHYIRLSSPFTLPCSVPQIILWKRDKVLSIQEQKNCLGKWSSSAFTGKCELLPLTIISPEVTYHTHWWYK